MSEQLRFDGDVVIVTGAGNGLGREYALFFAKLGARVVVNDVGAEAEQVVAEISALGGTAIAVLESVENGARIVQAAMDAFGQVDAVVNNAGFLRDSTFQNMSVADWEAVQRVHLQGTYAVTHAAWPVMRARKSGRILMTTSAAGIYGNFGQSNYAAAKLGILGLANTLAVEGRSAGILVNTIAPMAGSRLTTTVFPPDISAALKPAYVAPLVGWLCHKICTETGGLYEAGGGFVAKLRWERSPGHSFPLDTAFGIDDVARNWSRITDFSASEHPTDVHQAMAPLMANIARATVDASLAPAPAPTTSTTQLSSATLFSAIKGYLATNKGLGDQIRTLFQFDLKSPDSVWTLDLKTGDGEVRSGPADRPDVTLSLSDDDFIAMVSGKADATKMYLGGKLKLTGNVMAAQKLGFLSKVHREAPAPDLPAQKAPVASGQPQSTALFEALASRLPNLDAAATPLQGRRVQFQISDPDLHWVLDLTGKIAQLQPGRDERAEATVSISDQDFVELASGRAAIRDLYQRGSLRVNGELALVKHLTFLTAPSAVAA